MQGNLTASAAAVYIVDGARTPFLKSSGRPGPFSAADMAQAASSALLMRHPIAASDLDEVIVGCVMPSPREANIARLLALRLGCGDHVPAWTVQRNCASGMQALDAAAKDIATSRAQLVLAGGTETMSRAPLLFSPKAQAWFSALQIAARRGGRLGVLSRFRPSFLAPRIALLEGLTDHFVQMNMPQTAEYLAYRLQVSRLQMDEYALLSQQRAAAAEKDGVFSQDIVPLFDARGRLYEKDDGIRSDTRLEKLAQLKPIINRRFGTITAGNSSQISDGAAMCLLASEQAVKQYVLPVAGRIIDTVWTGVDPRQMGVGPVPAVQQLLKRYNMQLDDIGAFEINEAFAAQVLSCVRAFNDKEYAERQWSSNGPYGELPMESLNEHGGAIALGHPVGASGARIVWRLLRTLQRKKQRYGVAAICIGGGQGGAMLIECLADQ